MKFPAPREQTEADTISRALLFVLLFPANSRNAGESRTERAESRQRADSSIQLHVSIQGLPRGVKSSAHGVAGFSLSERYPPRRRRSAISYAITSARARAEERSARVRELAERRAIPRRSTGVEVPRQTAGCHPRSYPRTSAISTLPPSFRELYACPQEIHPRRISRPCFAYTCAYVRVLLYVRVYICIRIYVPACTRKSWKHCGEGVVGCACATSVHTREPTRCVLRARARAHQNTRYLGIEDADRTATMMSRKARS